MLKSHDTKVILPYLDTITFQNTDRNFCRTQEFRHLHLSLTPSQYLQCLMQFMP